MADSKISDLAAVTDVLDTDEFVLARSGATKKIDGVDLRSEITADNPSNATFNDHSARHENGGADEITIAGLDGTPVELTNHLNDATDAHDASAISFSPTGTVSATDVQAAIAEVASESGGAGLPVGGTDGQVLTKLSSTDYDADWETPTGGAGAMVEIEDILLGADTASFDFLSIAGTYKHLLIEMVARGTTAATAIAYGIRFNNDSSAIYDTQRIAGVSTTLNSAQTNAQTSVNAGAISAASAPAGQAGQVTIRVDNYAGTVFEKLLTTVGTYATATGAGGLTQQFQTGRWRSTAAVTRITIFPTAGNFLAGSRATLYGIG